MSGGKFNYKDTELKSEVFGYGPHFTNIFEDLEISEIVWDILDLIHTFDWYYCGDIDEDKYLEHKKCFKDKWFVTDSAERLKRVIDDSLEEVRKDLYKTYGIQE